MGEPITKDWEYVEDRDAFPVTGRAAVGAVAELLAPFREVVDLRPAVALAEAGDHEGAGFELWSLLETLAACEPALRFWLESQPGPAARLCLELLDARG